MKEKLKDIISWLFIISLGATLAYLIIGGLMKRQSLNKNWEYAEAVVMDHFSRIRYTHYFSYKFSVGENEYQGEGRYFSENDTISAGDTITVIYDRTDPNNSATLRDYLGRSF